MPIKISLIEDVSSVVKGSKDAAKSFDDVADSLDDMARDAQRAGKTTGDSIDKGADLATRSVETLERSFKDMASESIRQSKKAGDELGDNFKRGTKEASEGTDTLKENAGSNAKEIAASFDGSAGSIADGFQGLAAEALEGFGPLGLAAGVALAAGAGIFKSQWEQSAADTKEIMGSMFDDLLESETGYLSESYQRSAYFDILKGESKILSAAELDRIAKNSGLTNEQVAAAYAGNLEEMQRVTDGLIARREVFQKQLEDSDQTNDDAAKSGIAYENGLLRANEQRVEQIERSIEATKRAQGTWNQYGDAAQGSAARAGDAFDSLGRRLATAVPRTLGVELTLDTTALDRYRALLRRNPLTVAVVPGVRQPV